MKNEYKVTKKLVMSWAKELQLFGAASVILFVLWIIAGVIGLANLVIAIVLKGAWLNIYLGVLLLVFSIYKLFVARFFIWNERYKLYSNVYGVTEWIRATEFTLDEITLTDHTSVTKVRYENIKKIKEKGNTVMIFLTHGLAMRLYKDAFVEGSWDECKEIINSKCK